MKQDLRRQEMGNESQAERRFTNRMRRTTLEEHFVTTEFIEGPGRDMLQMLDTFARSTTQFSRDDLIDRLLDLGEQRISDMDLAGVDMQVLSFTRGVEAIEEEAKAVKLAHDSNDILAQAVKRHPTRFSGFATLPVSVPAKAADELERVVKEYGFKGTMIHGHSRGRYLDDKFFWPILERAEELKVPIYLHPTPPPQSVIKANYIGNYSKDVATLLSIAGWGWHIETALHLLRIMLCGALDAYPKLQLVIGHLGEGLPFMMPRIEHVFSRETTKLDRHIGDYLRENVYYTFSGFNYTSAFLDLFLQVGAERIMFSADYPYFSMVEAQNFLDQLPVSPKDKEKIAHGNAEQLLGL